MRIDARFLAIAHDRRTVGHDAGPVLSAHGMPGDLVRIQDAHGFQQLGLLIADGVGRDRARRFHAQIGEHLQHVVLDHVAQHAGAVVVAAAALDADGLGDSELDMVHVVLVPQGQLDSQLDDGDRAAALEVASRPRLYL